MVKLKNFDDGTKTYSQDEIEDVLTDCKKEILLNNSINNTKEIFKILNEYFKVK
jgi:hypothetical protein